MSSMPLSRAFLVLSACAVLLLSSPAARAQSNNPSFVPSLTWSAPSQTILPRRTYPACTYNVHAPINAVPLMFTLGGEANYSNQVLNSDLWYSTDGFYADSHQIQPTSASFLNAVNTTFQHRRAGSAAYLYNQNLLWFGGKTDDPTNANGGQMNSVYTSTDLGNTWSQYTAPWTPRSDIATCVPPYTNVVYAAGGQNQSGLDVNDVWLSSDGIGQVWTQQPMPPFGPLQSGACAFFYDSVLSTNSSGLPMATLMLLDNNGQFFLSTNYGQTYTTTTGTAGPWSTAVNDTSFNFMNLLIDHSNVAYVFAGQNDVNPAVYWSNNYGATWYTLNAVNALGLADGAVYSYATTSCAAVSLYQNAVTGAFYKEITIYGGSIWMTDGNIYESLHGITSSAVSLGSSVPQIIWQNATTLLPRRTYPACTFNVHAPATALPLMFTLGGEVNYTNQILTNDVWYSTDGFYSDSHQIQPTSASILNAVNTTFQHRRAGSAAFLVNGNLLWFGGKTDDPTNANGGQMNTVYTSSDLGNTWSQYTAPWTPRSDIATCVAPFTNVVYAAGGQIQTGADLNDVWMTSDGTGQTWTQLAAAPFKPLQSGACAFFYDSSLVNSSSSSAIATLMLLDNNGQYWLSTNYGQTYTGTYGPWLTASQSRNFMNVLIDRDNFVYVFSGQNYVDPNVYFSSNRGASWVVLSDVSNLNLADGAYFSYATTSCAAISLYQNGISGLFYKQITIYGGSVWLSDGTIVEAIHGTTNLQATVSVPQVTWTAVEPYITPRRTYPACTYNIHTAPNVLPIMFVLGGEVNYTNQILTNDVWYSTDGFYSDSHQIQPTSASILNAVNTTFQHRRAGSAAFLVNGNLLWFGGKTDDPTNANGGQMNTVYTSSDLGNTWSQYTAPWTPRSDIATCVAPFTNVVYAAGGQIQTGADLNDVWMTSDGTGQTWTQLAAAPFKPLQSGACAFFYDSSLVNSSSSSAIATLMLLDNNGQYWLSTNYGQTYTGTYGPWLTASQSRNFMNVLIDRDNFVYVFSGQNYVDPNVYFSSNKGATWSVLVDVSSLGLPDGAIFSYATTSCAGLLLTQAPGSSTWSKTIAIYGGSVWLTDGSIVEAIHGRLSLISSVSGYSYVRYGSSSPTAAGNSSSSSSSSSSLSGGAIAGIVVGSVVGAVIILACFIFVCLAARRDGEGKKPLQLREESSRAPMETSQVEMH